MKLACYTPATMSIDLVQICRSGEPWFSVQVPSQTVEGKEYTVMIAYPDDPVAEYICECEGFVHRGHCAHQEIAADSLCRWASFSGPEEQTKKQQKDKVCPRCGGETTKLMTFL